MTIYSIMPEESVFQGWDQHQPQYMDIMINGVGLQVEMLNGVQARIVRLHSANTNDYLNPAYAPGTLIEFQPSLS